MPKRNLYVTPAQEEVWTVARRMADDAGLSLSTVVTRALQELIQRADGGEALTSDPFVSCPECGAAVKRDSLTAHERWHTDQEPAPPND